MFRSKNLLITGGAGFIGSNFIKYILNKFRDVNIFNLDKLTYASNIKSLNEFENYKNYKFIKGDICDTKLLSKLFQNYKIDGIINFAAETHVDNSISNPKLFIETNINGTFNLLNVLPNDKSSFLFDPGSYGQYLGGTHKKKFSKGFIDKDHIVGIEILNQNVKPILFKNTYYVEKNDRMFDLVNLHVHSKKLKNFLPQNYSKQVKISKL